jgi:hypothetical protein
MSADPVSDMDLSYTRRWDAVQMATQAWVRQTRPR